MTPDERRAALDAIAAEVRACDRCRLAATRTKAVPGEGHPDTEVVFVGEGPGSTEDREGRPFVGRAGELLVRMLSTIGWRRDEVFITNVVKCRPPENRDPEPDEVAACAPFLRRQLEILDPALVVTLGRHSLGRFMPGARISQAHGTTGAADPATGAPAARVFAMYHPAAALRSGDVERQSFEDVARIPVALLDARRVRGARTQTPGAASPVQRDAPASAGLTAGQAPPAASAPADPAPPDDGLDPAVAPDLDAPLDLRPAILASTAPAADAPTLF